MKLVYPAKYLRTYSTGSISQSGTGSRNMVSLHPMTSLPDFRFSISGFQDGCFRFRFVTKWRSKMTRAEVSNHVRSPSPSSHHPFPVLGSATAACLEQSARRRHPAQKPPPAGNRNRKSVVRTRVRGRTWLHTSTRVTSGRNLVVNHNRKQPSWKLPSWTGAGNRKPEVGK